MQSVFHKPPPRPPGYLHGAASQGKPQQQARREGRSPARAACVFYRRQQLVTLHFRNAERAHWELLRAVLQALTPGAGTAVLHTPSARAAQERPQQLQALPCPVCLPAHLQQSTPLSHEHIMPLKHPVPHDYAASSLQLSLWGVANTHTSPKISQNNSVDLSGFFFFFLTIALLVSYKNHFYRHCNFYQEKLCSEAVDPKTCWEPSAEAFTAPAAQLGPPTPCHRANRTAPCQTALTALALS